MVLDERARFARSVLQLLLLSLERPFEAFPRPTSRPTLGLPLGPTPGPTLGLPPGRTPRPTLEGRPLEPTRAYA
eukprot:9182176-Pyramimonas_sp.AAC.1